MRTELRAELAQLLLGASIGVGFEIYANHMTFPHMHAAVWMYVAHGINFLVVFALVAVLELSWCGITRICRWQQLLQIILIIYDVILHTITMTKPNINHEFRDFRLASLASLIAVRLIMFRFFIFKAETPAYSYTHALHEKATK